MTDKEFDNRVFEVLADLLEMYEVDIDVPEVQENLVSAMVSINNYHNGFDDDGNKVEGKE